MWLVPSGVDMMDSQRLYGVRFLPELDYYSKDQSDHQGRVGASIERETIHLPQGHQFAEVIRRGTLDERYSRCDEANKQKLSTERLVMP